MDNNYSIYLKKFKIALAILGLSVVISIALIAKTVPEIQKIVQIQQDTKTKSSELTDAERKLAELKSAAEKREVQDSNVLQMFFKPVSEGLDTEAAISDEFGEILQLMRDNKVKARSVKYDYDPQDDNFVKNAANKYHVCRVSAEMVANYADFANFVRELYKHEHFLDISKIEIVPYQKNKKILLVSFQIKLYAQRDPSSVVETPAPTENNANGDGQTPPSPQPTEGATSPEAAE